MTAFAAKLVFLIGLAQPGIADERAAEVAGHIVAAVGENLPAAVLLVDTAQGESAFRKEVETCKVTGDNGQAFSAFQLHKEHFGRHTRSEICRDPVLAAQLAHGALSTGGTVAERIARYMGRSTKDREVKRRAHLYERLMKAASDDAS